MLDPWKNVENDAEIPYNFESFLTAHNIHATELEPRCYHFDRLYNWAASVIELVNTGYVLHNIYVIQTSDGGRDMIAIYKHEIDRDKILLSYTLPL